MVNTFSATIAYLIIFLMEGRVKILMLFIFKFYFNYTLFILPFIINYQLVRFVNLNYSLSQNSLIKCLKKRNCQQKEY